MSSRQEDLEEENIGQEAYERALEVRNAKQEELDQAAAEKQEELVPLESVGATLAEEPIKDLIKQQSRALSKKGEKLGRGLITKASESAESKLKALALKHQAGLDSLVERGGPLRDTFASFRNKLIPGRPLAASRPAGPSLGSAFDDILGGKGVVGDRNPVSQVLARFKNSAVDTSLLPRNSYFNSGDADSDAGYADDVEDLSRKIRRAPPKFRAKTAALPVKEEGSFQDALNPMREELARRANRLGGKAQLSDLVPRSQITSILPTAEPDVPRMPPRIPPPPISTPVSDPNIVAAAENAKNVEAAAAGTKQLADAKAKALLAGANLDEDGKIIKTGAKASESGLAGALEGTTDAAAAEDGINPFVDIIDAGLGIASLFGLAHKTEVPKVDFNPINVGVQHGV